MRKHVGLLAAVFLLLFSHAQYPVSTQPAAAPVLLVVNSAAPNPFGGYLAEILRTEGLPAFTTAELSTLTADQLASASLVVLAETPLISSQSTLISNYVAGGGRLIAMRPDAALASVLGVTSSGSTLARGYVAIDTGTSIGGGFQSTTLPFRGSADTYTLSGSGATQIAALYTDQTTPAGHPAVVRYGNTITWTFDLARSVVYTRQGDPSRAGVETDNVPPIRTEDVFYGDIDLDRVRWPHADILMRLFSRSVQDLLADTFPMPRLWYFPHDNRTVLIATSDTHGLNGTSNTANLIAAVEARGGHLSTYITRWITPGTPNQMTAWRTAGHEFGLHPYGYQDGMSLDQGFTTSANWFATLGIGAPGATVRNHQIEWPTWVGPAYTAVAHGVAMDVSEYTWGPAITYANPAAGAPTKAHGYINGSGLAMRAVDIDGTLIPLYQQTTSLIDESLLQQTGPYSENLTPSQALVVSQQIIDDSQAGGYSAVATQFHADYFPFGEVQPWDLGTLDYAASLNIPIWTAEHWLHYTTDRAAASIDTPVWAPTTQTVTFNLTLPSTAESHSVTLAGVYTGHYASSVTVDGVNTPFTSQTITGRTTIFFDVAARADGTARNISVTYNGAAPNQAPSAGNVTASTAFNTPVSIAVLTSDSDPDGDPLTVTAVTQPSRGTATIVSNGTSVLYTPTTGLCGSDSFGYTISDGRGGIASGSVSVTVVCPPNNPPTAQNDSATTGLDTIVTISVLANDSDPDNDPLTVTNATGATNGTLTITSNNTTVLYTPTAGVCGADSFTYTISDGRGGTASASVSVSVSCSGSRTQSTRQDFLGCASARATTQVTGSADGEVALAAGLADDFTTSTLAPQWTAGAWEGGQSGQGGAYMPSIANCVLSLSGLNGAFVHSSAAATVATFEARAQFSAAQWEHIGWGALDFNGDQYLLFSTFNQTSHLYARSNLGGGETRTDLGVMPSGFHTYRIERVAISGVDHVRYSIDGIQLADHIPGGTVPTLYVYLSHNSQTTTPTLDIHSISVSAPFITTGTFDSAPMDAGKTVAWTTATWTATLPPNTTLAVRTRTSNDGSTWSTWSAPLTTTGAPLTSPAGRYAQYRLELSTSDPTTSPSVQSVTLTFNSQ